jgi:hypothetical protein
MQRLLLIATMLVSLMALWASCGDSASFRGNDSTHGKAATSYSPPERREDDENEFTDDIEEGETTQEDLAEGQDTGVDIATQEKLKRLPKFGLLVNDLECGLCHVSVIGDVVSTRRVPPLWQNSNVRVTGRWLAADEFDAKVAECTSQTGACPGRNVTVRVAGGITEGYRGLELPLDTDADGKPDFPSIAFDQLSAKMTGRLTAGGAYPAEVDKVHDGNLVVVGTQQAPIVLAGDVLIRGDVVLKGWYTGTGSIYATGNVYIPADLRAVRSAFPYADNEAQALAQARAQVAARDTDALGIATAKSIFLADIEKHQNSDQGLENDTVYDHELTPENRRGTALGVLDVLRWFPGGRAAFDSLYEQAVSCETGNATQIASFNLVEAFLYARNTVAGISRRASFSLRGGVIADYFHVVSGASKCDSSLSAVHGRPGNRSYIEYDFRLRTGLLPILEHVAEAFPAAP